MLKKMRIDKIKILPAFESCPPRAEKLQAKRDYYASRGRYDRDLAIDNHGWLVDGYATYLVMKENGESTVCVDRTEDVWPAIACDDGSGRWDWYHVPMGLARRLRPGQRTLLFSNGRLRVLRVRNIELFSGRPCWQAWGIALPGVHTGRAAS